MYGCESWTVKKRQIAKEVVHLNSGVGEDSWNSPGQQGDQPVNLQGDQPWILIGRTDAEAEALVFLSSDVNSWLTGKVPHAGKEWGQKKMSWGWDGWSDGITEAMDMNLGKLQEMVKDREAWCAAVHRVVKNRTWMGDWATTKATDASSIWTPYMNEHCQKKVKIKFVIGHLVLSFPAVTNAIVLKAWT